MDIRVHAAHMTLADDLQALIRNKVGHATRVFDDTGAIDVEVSAEHNPRISEERVRLEITSSVAGQVVRVEAAGADERAALDVAIEKYERRLRHLKERLITRHRRGSEKRLNDGQSWVEESTQEDHELRIDRVKRFAVKPMTPQEAALQMELLGHSFYLFLNADTDRYGVLYRRRGGSLGLIEPQ
ncbi:MAG: ribosome-associated translation inhibitor RaiA [Actinomycetota bacterium]